MDSLQELIKKAQGERSQNEYALHSGVSSASITRILQEQYKPSPSTLKKLADRAHNGVTYEQLMVASGYIADFDNPTPSNEKKDTPAEVSDADIMFALFGGDAEEITDDMYEDVKNFARFIKENKKGKSDGTT